ncbi:response regulator transcription factor [Adlercreutzia muris]|jgi:DNA-binding response OmpR family regulator|uniref:response regulator transcription factor n=1 Tax=Adlercreutzia muris TaxID=1796610 RepID=UPI001365B3A7|nr:response regulator transcription factor [Adlercreutzia muris]MCI8305734.1 response regulator transcription factor [Enterorhabdus sp.]MCI9673471.1 response regulator transcription factor [Enterorhabdus sp.]NCA32488.1 DNA-binding response regulator [Adlercreutzia muris]
MDTPLDILVIEDDPSINEVVTAHLERQGHRCRQAFSGTEGTLLLREQRPDLVITDLMLPGITGEEIVRAIRAADGALPIIVISARITAADKIMLLQEGADDYLTKPFDLDELSARIAVQCRHRTACNRDGVSASDDAAADGHGPDSSGAAVLRFRDWVLNGDERTFAVGGIPVALTRTEFNILELLMARPRKVFTKQELFELAWGEPYSVEDSTVNVHVSNLRRKLKPTGTDGYLQTVWGMGFKLTTG